VIVRHLRCQAHARIGGFCLLGFLHAAGMRARGILAAACVAALALSPAQAAENDGAGSQETIPIEAHDGAYVVPVLVNGILPLKFIVDSGSADVSIPSEVAMALKKMGTMSAANLLGSKTYLLADGSKVSSEIYRIESLKIGDLVMQNVTARVSGENSSLLLGQSFLRRLKSWSVDNAKQVLIINGGGS
jgi:clan AA aspartic protease (TIGR02281 family)